MKYSLVHLMVGILAALSYLGASWGLAPPYWFPIVTLILFAYFGYELHSCAVNEPGNRWLVNPAVLSSLDMFVICYGVTNVLFYTPLGQKQMFFLYRIDYTLLGRAEALALWGALSMWLGYRSQVGLRSANKLRELFHLDVLLSRSWELNWSIVWICVLTSLGCRLAQIHLGMYGYNTDLEELSEKQSYRQYLLLSGDLGKLALLALTLHCAGSKRTTVSTRLMMYGLFLSEFFFGLLSGFKSQAVMPALIIVICYYTVRGKVPLAWLAAVPVSICLAYFFIEPMRANRYNDPKYDNRSLLGISSVLMDPLNANDIGIEDEELESTPGFALLNRLNLTKYSATAVRLKENDELGEDSPDFLADLILAPAYAMIPRLLWPDKPVNTTGRWFAIKISGENSRGSAALTPVGQLYLVGGAVVVCLGFFAVGIVQRIVYQVFWRLHGGGYLLVYLALLGNITRFHGTVSQVFVPMIRVVPLLVLCQYFLFKRS